MNHGHPLENRWHLPSRHPAARRRIHLEGQGFVGGYIQIITLDEDSLLVVNEDGHAQGLPRNSMGTQLYHAAGGLPTPVVGDVLVCSAKEVT